MATTGMKTLDALASEQHVKPITDPSVLFGTWPGEANDGFEEMIDMSDLHDLSEHGDVVIVLERMRGHDKPPQCCLCGETHINSSEKYEDAQHKEHPQALAYWMGRLYCQLCYETLTLPYWEYLPKLHVVERS